MTLKEKWTTHWKQLKEKYHLSVVNKDLFVEVYSFQFSKIRFYTTLIVFLCLIAILTFGVIAFSPLKRFVPGFESDKMHRILIDQYKTITQLDHTVDGKVTYYTTIDSILINGNVHPDSINWHSSQPNKRSKQSNLLSPKVILPQELKQLDLNDFYFFKPVKGIVSKAYAPTENHFGIDLVCETNETVKSVLDGRVLLSTWTVEFGHILMIQHENNLITTYKHNSVSFKKQGDNVNAGEVIAVVGNSGNLSNGPHLHFELWHNENSLNPEKIFNFSE